MSAEMSPLVEGLDPRIDTLDYTWRDRLASALSAGIRSGSVCPDTQRAAVASLIVAITDGYLRHRQELSKRGRNADRGPLQSRRAGDHAGKPAARALAVCGTASPTAMCTAAEAIGRLAPNGRTATPDGRVHNVEPGALAPVLIECFGA